jgi:hypothetical protein
MVIYSETATTTTLDGSIGAADQQLVPAADSAFPSSRNFVVQIDDELIQVGQLGAGAWRDLNRGFNGTAAAAHDDGTRVILMIDTAPTTVAGTYGSATHIPSFTLDDDRRVVSIQEIAAVPDSISGNATLTVIETMLEMLASLLSQSITTTLEISDLNSAGTAITPAPPAGSILVVQSILWETIGNSSVLGHTFSLGGPIIFRYVGSAVLATAAGDNISTDVMHATTPSVTLLSPIAAGIQVPEAAAIEAVNTGSAFGSSIGNSVRVAVQYRIVALPM